MSADAGPGTREVARRLFAAEFEDATFSYSESDEERAPNYVVTPTGARVNRLFAVGVLTEVEQVNEDSLRGRVVDPTGAFVTYAGQYQPDEHAFLSRTEPPTFVALAGKARTFEPEDSDRVFTSVRPESLNEVDADTRDRWVVSAAERTLDRIAVFAEALDSDLRGDALREALEAEGVDPSLAAGIPKAIAQYDTGTAYLEAVRTLAVEAVEQVAGERDAVGALETPPGDSTPTELGPLPETDVSLAGVEPDTAEAGESEAVETEEPAETAEESVEAEKEPTETAEESADTATEEQTETEPAAAPAVEPTSGEAEPQDGSEEDASEEPDEPAESEAEEEPTGEKELGDFDADESVQETVEQEAEELGDFEPGETVEDETEALTEEEREEVKEEFGTEFATGTEVDEPGEADIEVPTSEDDLEELEDEDGEATEEAEASEGTDEDEETAVDLETAAVETIDELDEGDGVAREDVVAAVVDEHGVDADAADDAIQEAMMSGKCYEPNEGTLKAI
ncbi:MAG: RPA family protein [Halolamina sp.]